jgi:hypothetical protein
MKKKAGRGVSTLVITPKTMKLGLVLVVLACAGLRSAPGAQEAKVTYYVQLVRGTDEAKPPSAESKPIGPKLAGRLRPVFRWEHYWEISRHEVGLTPGQTVRVEFNKERSVEIFLSAEGTRKVTAHHHGKPVTSLSQPAGTEMTILGGDREGRTGWFMVIRRDKPTVD